MVGKIIRQYHHQVKKYKYLQEHYIYPTTYISLLIESVLANIYFLFGILAYILLASQIFITWHGQPMKAFVKETQSNSL